MHICTHTHTHTRAYITGLVPNGDHSSLRLERDDERSDRSPQRHADHRGHPWKDKKLLRLCRDRKGALACTYTFRHGHTTGNYTPLAYYRIAGNV